MPAAPTLSTTVTAGGTGHVADTNTVHGIINATYKTPVGSTKTGNYTLVQANSAETIPVDSASSVAITVPVLEAGTTVHLLRKGAGAVTLTASSTTLTGPTGATLTPRAQGSRITLQWITTTDVRVSGDLTNLQYIDAKWYGAVGNDSADDTTALDNAAAAAISLNLPLYIPAGTYRRTTALDLRGVGVVSGHTRQTTIIKQMTSNTACIRLGHAGQVAANLQATYGTAPTSAHTNANGFEFYHAQKCQFTNLYAYQCGRGFYEPVVTYSSPGIPSTLNFYFSNVATSLQATGFAINAFNFEGGTGNVWNNIYMSNNPAGTRLAPSSYALSIRVMDENVFNQLNIEWMLASNAPPVLFESGGNQVINSMHIEQVELSYFGTPFIATSDKIKLLINGLTLVWSSVTNAGTHALVNHYQNTDIDIRGFHQHDNTVSGTFVADNINGATAGATFKATAFDTALFTAISANELAAPNQVVREVNGNRYLWQQNGKNHTTGTAAPASGTWAVGDTVWNTAPAAGGAPGWVCTTAGTPGTWKAMPNLAI